MNEVFEIAQLIMNNDYNCKKKQDYKRILKDMDYLNFNKYTEDEIYKKLGSYIYNLEFRKVFSKYASFAVPSKEAIDFIGKYCPKTIDVMAGTGYWAYLLNQSGFDCIASDITLKNEYGQRKKYINIEEMDALDAIEKYPDRDVIICWAPYTDDIAFKIAQKINKGRKIIHIGEGKGGCTADDKFYDLIFSEKYKPIDYYDIVRFEYINDRMFIIEKQ